MSETVNVEFKTSIDNDKQHFVTKTNPEHEFVCYIDTSKSNDYKKVVVHFLERDVNFTILQQLNIVAAMLEKGSNFKEEVSLHLAYSQEELTEILLKVDLYTKLVVKKDTDLEDIAKDYYRTVKKYIVFSDDTEERILERDRDIKKIKSIVWESFLDEKYTCSTPGDVDEIVKAFYQYLQDYTLGDDASKRDVLFLEAIQAEASYDYIDRDWLLKKADIQ